MLPTTLRWILVLLSSSLLFAACGGGSDDDGTVPPPPPDPDEPAIALERVFPSLDFEAPVLLLQAPGDESRWFVVEQSGVVRVFDSDPAVAASTVFANLESQVNDSFSESGLLGMAFHPGFPTTPYVYVSYTATGQGGAPLISRISRLQTMDGGATASPASEEVLLTVLQDNTNHNGGHLAFGPDGFLYAGFGDGGGSGDPGENAQNPTNLLGTILRIDVDGGSPYAIPPSNPFSANLPCPTGASPGGDGCPEILAWGLRNPWRFSFDRTAGTLWAGDVGQGNWEEVNRVEAGNNYGWDEREGAHCFEPPSGCDTSSADPVAEYDHGTGQSVTGGYVYRGNAIPELQGEYVFADFVAGRIFSVPSDSQPTVAAEELIDTDLRISTFGEGQDGELYVVDYAAGTLHRIVPGP